MHHELYDLLGVKPDASPSAIKKAWLKYARTHHPDSEGGDEDLFKRGEHAYAILSDPARRSKYDATGDDTLKATPEDPERAKILGILSVIMENIMTQDLQNMKYSDMRVKILGDLAVQTNKFKDDARQISEQIDRATELSRRFKTQEDQEDLVGMSLRSKLSGLEERRRRNQEAQELHEKVIQVFLQCQYETDPIWEEGQVPQTGPVSRRAFSYLGGTITRS